jgi:pyruvate kinase
MKGASLVEKFVPAAGVPEIATLGAQLDQIEADMSDMGARNHDRLDLVQPAHRASASNLIDYLTLRGHDLRVLQARLTALGLSSLGRAEGSVRASLDAVRRAVRALATCDQLDSPSPGATAGGAVTLDHNTDALLGPAPADRRVRIMVTMPGEAAHDYTLVHDLVRAGMDCMRINCAHDDTHAWASMIEHLRRANQALGRKCQVAMDLGGPKLRTGPLLPGPMVIKIRPERDVFGRVVTPARIWLSSTGSGSAPAPAAAVLHVTRAWLHELERGDSIELTDARAARRTLKVVDVDADGAWAETKRTCYLVPDTQLLRATKKKGAATTAVGSLPARVEPIRLHVGDILIITRNLEPGHPARHDEHDQLLAPAAIGCTLPEVFDEARPGERIWLDDGRIGGVIETVETGRVFVRVDRARPQGEKLLADKGINLPETALRLSALTAKDIEDLEFVAKHADLVSLSFVNSAADVELVQQHLQRLGGEHLGIILKIETRRGFEALPEMLLAALRSPRCGVMIARGDLAVECGFERMAELQEEILWVCEAAHVPVIWATQVLENLAKDGVPSRAEISDAAMSERAECVMLNKGPHVREAVRVLDDILRRMQAHVTKKRSMLRELKLATHFLSATETSSERDAILVLREPGIEVEQPGIQ